MSHICKNCEACQLFKNQQPMATTYHINRTDLMWVGLSAKRGMDPLALSSRSGALVANIENSFPLKLSTYKTNLVKCLPLDKAGKIRYPSGEEILFCIANLHHEILFEIRPRIVFLLGDIVASAVFRHLGEKRPVVQGYSYGWTEKNGIFYVPIQHPSYISIYRRNKIPDYTEGIRRIITTLLNH